MAPTGSVRDLRVDSATGVLIILVVLGHTLATMDGGAAHAALFWLYTFHMPAFVFISGYVTRFARTWSPLSIVTRLLFPYVVFALVQRVLESALLDRPFDARPLAIPWTLWYLIALMVWRLVTPLIAKVPFGVGVGLAAVLSVAGAGISWIGPTLSLGRIVGFFPFFVAGLLWREEWWGWLLSRWARVVATVVMVGSALWAIPNHRIVSRAEFFFSQSYDDLELAPGEGMTHRMVILIVAAVLALSVISLAMRAVPLLAGIGVASLTVYLLHAVVLLPWHIHGAPGFFSGVLAVLAAVVGSFALAWLLARAPVVKATRPVMDSRWWGERVAAARKVRASP